MIDASIIQFAVVVTASDDGYTMYIPDLHMTIDGSDYVELYARAVVSATAVVHYNKEHNLTTKFSTTYEDVAERCHGKSQFPTYLALM